MGINIRSAKHGVGEMKGEGEGWGGRVGDMEVGG